ncbi:hypothetical protein [Psychroflexus sediminis]|uniref:Uncharacterized protein n=1 Tax=Psychroflexus sediminis TaxID=470826 RepID=A0A1G7Y754_9FLAO|nr:hypothetical protein [Psychroflexus sediminis]SDG92207.1 hypothetical protein SAMN04488027_11112 [Psychroflexus sediminis]
MKKVILTFALSTLALGMNAQTEEIKEIGDTSECMDEAWAAGTEAGEQAGGVDTMWGSVIAYIETDKYYRENCL